MNCSCLKPFLLLICGGLFALMLAKASGAGPTLETRLAGPPQSGLSKPSGNPALEIPRGRWNLRGLARPAPLKLTPEQKAMFPPPDWIVVYRPATGEIRYEPPSALPEKLRALGASNSRPSNPGALGKTPSLFNIIGDDGRERVSPTTGFPWRVIGKMYMVFPNDAVWVGSGSLIDPFHVFTAGHNLYNANEGGWVKEVEFIPGMDGNYAPFSSAWDVEVRAPSGWVGSHDPDFDWGLITLDRNVGNIIGWFGYAYEPESYYPNRVFNLAGYPDDRDQGLGLYWDYNIATFADQYALYYLMDTAGGQSGSPVWRYIQNQDQHQVMAVHAYGAPDENSGTRINASLFAELTATMASDPPPRDYADLIDDGVQFAGFSPGAVSAGAPFEVYCDVRNIGTTTTLPFLVTFYASTDQNITPDDRPIGAVYVPALEPFTYVTCRWQGAFPGNIPLGNYYVGWIIDSTNSVVEISETNNTAFLPALLTVGTAPNLNFVWADFNPAAPVQMAPGDPLWLAAHIQNTGGTPARPFWLEFWGSRTGGLTVSYFLANSARPGPINPGAIHPYSASLPLYGLPDGPYTVVIMADRPNEVAESNENDNRVVIGGKRLLVIRPQTNVDLRVEGFGFGPNPAYSGQTLSFTGYVRNVGTQPSGPFWIEFWGSRDRLYPSMDFFLCDSIAVSNLAPGAGVNLAGYSRTLYGVPSGIFMVGCVADRPDGISEPDETNNYQFLDGYYLNRALGAAESGADKSQLADLTIALADFAPNAPYQAPPGSPLTLWARVENRGAQNAGPFWVEFFGSRTGGIWLDEFLADSVFIPGLPAGAATDLALNRSLYSIPDGPYSVVVAVDRPGMVAESNEANNRRVVAGKRLLTIRQPTQANLIVEGFTAAPNPLHRGQPVVFGGRVRNTGTQNSGPFWIEFWVTRTPDQPQLDAFLCDSIFVPDLPPAAALELSAHARTVYSRAPLGSVGIICFADKTDLVNETHEEDNYTLLKNFQISP